jgi:galactose mutarotase-like enzyme
VNIKQDIFGKLPDGNKVYIFTLSSDGITAKISNFGATLISLTRIWKDILEEST